MTCMSVQYNQVHIKDVLYITEQKALKKKKDKAN